MNEEIKQKADELASSDAHAKVRAHAKQMHSAALNAQQANQGLSQTEMENRSGGPDSVYGDEIDEQREIANEAEAKQSVINDAIDQKREDVAEEENFVAEGHQQYRGPS